MVSLEHVQQSIIDKLKLDVPLVAVVGLEIREDSWQGTEFAFPAIRIALGTMRPSSDGCRLHVPIDVQCFSEEASSLQALQLINLVADVLEGTQLHDATFRTLDIWLETVVSPVRANPRIWRGDAYFATEAYEVGP